jgi:hypothetical protein
MKERIFEYLIRILGLLFILFLVWQFPVGIISLLAIASLTFLTCVIIYGFKKRGNKYLSFSQWWDMEGLPLFFLIGLLFFIIAFSINTRVNGPGLPDEESGDLHPTYGP